MPITRNKNTTNSVLNPVSRYSQGGDTDRFNNRLGFWDRYAMPRSSDDIRVLIDRRTAGRPDLVAFDVYDKATLQWFVLQYNHIVDVNEEFTAGTTIILPTPARLTTTFLSHSTGGTRVTDV